MEEFKKDILMSLKVITFCVALVTSIYCFKFVTETSFADAGNRWNDVNIAAVGGNPVYDSIPTK